MANVWFLSLISVFVVSLLSFVGVVTLAVKKKYLEKILLLLVSFSAGALFGGAFLHLIPESLENIKGEGTVPLLVLAGLLLFFILEKFIHWRHCHIPTSKKHPHPFAVMNLIGNGLHNFIDGMIIAGSYLVSIPLGIATTVAVILHEIPQEIGDFGILIHAGYSRAKALLFNLFSALTAVIGAVVILLINYNTESITQFLIPFTAGGFIYIATADLIPELKQIQGDSSDQYHLKSAQRG